MLTRIIGVALFTLFMLLGGCGPTTRTYEVTLKNDMRQPITFGLVKEGGPLEREWASPEEAAIAGATPSALMWSALKPGDHIGTGPVKGKFDNGSRAVLRVYLGALKLEEILAASPGAPNRIDVPLEPGANSFVVMDQEGRFVAVRAPAGTAH